ncbi:MAG: hypothetical protein EON93_24625 [Burkholderiales bacterium]|nr:MAG: hypothetical protein EON93_24625 [Burkholderiales bacterium]
MRLTLLAVSALAFAACSESKPAETPVVEAPAAETPADAAHDMSGMDDTMKTADAADDANTAETTDGFTFHTIGGKIESVHLPTAAGVTWTASTTDTSLVDIGEAKDEAMPDGSTHHIVKVTPKVSGNAVVKFEKRQGDATTPVVETRNINFMIH